MRCPKCGFISFDHLTSCAKCGRDIAEVASELQGTSIKVETPMFLSSTLAAYADRDSSYYERGMAAEEEGIDFSMDMEVESGAGKPLEMAAADTDIDFSIAEEETDAAATMQATNEEAVDFTIEAEPEEEAAPEDAEEAHELDFMGADVEEEEDTLEFDLEDFIEEMDDDKSKSSGSEDVDLELNDEEK